MSKTRKSFDEEMIRGLAELLNDTDLSEIEIEQDDFRVRIARERRVEAIVASPATAAPSTASVSPAVPTPVPTSGKEAADHPGTVTSPMVGTAYLSPAPGSDPFVDVGSTVSEGQTIMIVEAMKTMNHIPAPRAGTVVSVLVESGHPVEFGEPLMIIE